MDVAVKLGLSEGSGTLGRNMTKAGMTHELNPFMRGDFQVHHAIPHEVCVDNQKFFNDVGLGGAKDWTNNGDFLPKNQAIANQHGFAFLLSWFSSRYGPGFAQVPHAAKLALHRMREWGKE